MTLYLKLAWRNIWRHRRRTFIILLSISMVMGLMMLYDGLIAGFEQAIYGNAIKVLGGNVQIHAAGYDAQAKQLPLLALPDDTAILKAVRARPEVVAASRRINTGGMATSRAGAFAVGIVGLEPEVEGSVNTAAQRVAGGRFLTAADRDVAFIGKGLADAMSLAVGDRFTLVGRAAHEQMRQRTMTVIGIYDIGLADLEKRTLYMSLGEAQDLYGLGGSATEIAITLQRIGQEPAVMAALRPAAGGFEMASWETSLPEMRAAIRSKGAAMDIFGVIMMIVAGIGIFNLLMMAVYERTREIGVLGALGLKPGQISLLFLLEGAMLGVVGLIAGIAFGLLINALLGQVGLDYSKFASMTEYTALISGKVYSTLGVENLLQRGIVVLIVAVIAAVYPAREAARNEPAKSLHFV